MNDIMSLAIASTPSLSTQKTKNKKQKPKNIPKMARRFAQGRNIWTGEMLVGEEARQWFRIWSKNNEESKIFNEIVKLVSVDKNIAIVQTTSDFISVIRSKKDGNIVLHNLIGTG